MIPLILTNHGFERLYERVQTKAQVKTINKARDFLIKVLERGCKTVDDANQTLINYLDTLYIFKKNSGRLIFVTVKTSQQNTLSYYAKGQKKSYSYKKDFRLTA